MTIPLTEKAPPGWSGTVKAMKRHMPTEKAFALAWDMYKKGAKPHYKSTGSTTNDKEPELKKKYQKEGLAGQLAGALEEGSRSGKEFKKGDIVRYTGKFLRNIGMQAGGPINGKVVGFVKMGGGKMWPKVLWSDRDEPHAVAPLNIEHDPRFKRKGLQHKPVYFESEDLNDLFEAELEESISLPADIIAISDFVSSKEGNVSESDLMRRFQMTRTWAKKVLKVAKVAFRGAGIPRDEMKRARANPGRYFREKVMPVLEKLYAAKLKPRKKEEDLMGLDNLFEEAIEEELLTEKGKHYYDGKSYHADTAFLNSIGDAMPGMKLKHMGFGEFSLEGNGKSIEFDRMRGKKFKGQSGRSHQVYDNKEGKLVKELIKNMEKKGRSELVREEVELEEGRQTGDDAPVEPTIKDFSIAPITRVVKKKKQWTEGDLKHAIYMVVRDQYYKKFKPTFGRGADEDHFRHVAQQFIHKLRRDGKLTHIGYADRSGKVVKHGYGDFVLAVEAAELDEAEKGKLPTEAELVAFMKEKPGRTISVLDLGYAFGLSPQVVTGFFKKLVKKGTLELVQAAPGRKRVSRTASYKLAEGIELAELFWERAEEAPPQISPARYAKNKMLVRAPSATGYKTRAARLADALKGKWTNRERGYIMSKTKAEKLKKLYTDGWDADFYTGKLEPPKKTEGIELIEARWSDALELCQTVTKGLPQLKKKHFFCRFGPQYITPQVIIEYSDVPKGSKTGEIVNCPKQVKFKVAPFKKDGDADGDVKVTVHYSNQKDIGFKPMKGSVDAVGKHIVKFLKQHDSKGMKLAASMANDLHLALMEGPIEEDWFDLSVLSCTDADLEAVLEELEGLDEGVLSKAGKAAVVAALLLGLGEAALARDVDISNYQGRARTVLDLSQRKSTGKKIGDLLKRYGVTEGELSERAPATAAVGELRSDNQELRRELERSVDQTRKFVRSVYHLEEVAEELAHAAQETERIRRTAGVERAMQRSPLGNAARSFEAETKKLYGPFAEGRNAMTRLAKMARISTRRAGKRKGPSVPTREITATNLVREVLQVTARMNSVIRESAELGSVAIREGEKLLNQKSVITGDKLTDRLSAYVQVYLDFRDQVSVGLFKMIASVTRRMNEVTRRLMKMQEGVEHGLHIVVLPWASDPDFEQMWEDEDIAIIGDGVYSQGKGWLEAVA